MYERDYTDNYDLDLYMPCDRPNLRDQYNTAMRKIDRLLKSLYDRDILFATDLAATDKLAREALDNTTTLGNTTEQLQAQDKVLEEAIKGKAPKYHASTSRDYGLGDTEKYGHVKLVDTYINGENVDDGLAITPKALRDFVNRMEGENTRLRNELVDLVQQINANAVSIISYNELMENQINTTNLTATYQHGLVQISLHQVPILPDAKLGQQGMSSRSAIIGYIPQKYCPPYDISFCGAAFGAVSTDAEFKEKGSYQAFPFVIKVRTDGYIIISQDGFQSGPKETAGQNWGGGHLIGSVTYMVPDMPIVRVGTIS